MTTRQTTTVVAADSGSDPGTTDIGKNDKGIGWPAGTPVASDSGSDPGTSDQGKVDKGV